jgi:hypothetical protein
MRFLCLPACALILIACEPHQQAPPVPIGSGTYTFQHRDAEFPDSTGFPVTLTIAGTNVTVTSAEAHGSLPAGVIDSGKLMWHSPSGQWILGHDESDRDAAEVGGCSGGPATFDFSRRILWTCLGGP